MATAIINAAEIDKLVAPIVRQAQGMSVADQDDYEYACEFLKLLAAREKAIHDLCDESVEAAHRAHRAATALRAKGLDPLAEAKLIVKRKASEFLALMERKRQEEERRLAEAARKEAEDRALAEAAALEARGEGHLAEIVMQEAAVAPAPVVVIAPIVQKVEGIASRKTWKYRVTNPLLIPREYLIENHPAISAMVRAQKGMTRIPGIEVYAEDSVSVRTA